jgi:signal transduction histidine kinase
MPVALWESDCSECKKVIDVLRKRGVTNFHSYFDKNPDEFINILKLRRWVRMNSTGKKFLGADRSANLQNVQPWNKPDCAPGTTNWNYTAYKDDIARLAEGQRKFTKQEPVTVFSGKLNMFRLGFLVAPGYEDSWGRILSALIDITKLVEAQKKLKMYQKHLEELVSKRTASLKLANDELKIEISKRKKTQEELRVLLKSERKLREQIKAQTEDKLLFIRTMVHELKTPLTPLIGASDYLSNELKDDILKRQARLINDGACRLNKRMNDLVDQTKAELGILRLKCQSVNLAEVIYNVKETMSPRAFFAQQNIKLMISTSLPNIWADEERLEQVIVNLLDNAMRYAKGIITIKAYENENKINIEVIDNGEGIALKDKKRLFKPYELLDQDSNMRAGLGLGLALCKTIVELHGGEIWLTSRVGKGTSVFFSLPISGL